MQNIEMIELGSTTSGGISNVVVTNKKPMHCKLTYNEQIRRFIFYGTEFAELQAYVSHLLALAPPQGQSGIGFVLKYVDNEGDLITITSNEDLNLAMDLSEKLLRLAVETAYPTPSPPTAPFDPTTPLPPPFSPGGGFYGRGRGRFQHHHHHHHGGYGAAGGMHQPQCPRGPYYMDKDKKEKAVTRIQSKIDFLKNKLEQLPVDDWKRQRILLKINRLEGRKLRWDGMCDKKMEKRRQKEEKKEKKEKKCEHKKLSPEALTQVQTLKTQIASLKPILYQLKATKKAKKSELELSLQTGQGDKETVWNEILRLKESIHETQKQISSLKDQIHAIVKSQYQ